MRIVVQYALRYATNLSKVLLYHQTKKKQKKAVDKLKIVQHEALLSSHPLKASTSGEKPLAATCRSFLF